ncbi:MAG: tetratricopeptide repeat protein [Verrucomicrobia bacterium]|nr:tetratricopeptide repeat protein [Verrucomicrobiota bacterium]MCH8526097.1 tetratricopeptide repeat protein [Kiritimatiellia bacterium]
MKAIQSISAYTPSNMAPELLEKLFVQREKLLTTLVDRLARSVESGERQHFLLIGPRGSGKTHLISLVESRLSARDGVKKRLRIAWLGEDDVFSSLVHLAIGILKVLNHQYPGEFSDDILSTVRGRSSQDAADAILRDIVNKLGDRSLLLITENLDLTFQSMGDTGQKQWRAFLQETRKVSTLASSQQLFAGVSERTEAFFGFFDLRHLEPLSVEDARELMIRISDLQNDTELRDYLDSPEGLYRMRALHYLAGGNHRMYVLLAEFLNRESLQELVSAFEELADSMTPYFQERVRSLPDQQRQLVQGLCDAHGARTVKELAGDTFIEERTCAKQLGLLKQKGYVRSHKRGKESYYDMAEPLMRLCLEAKNQRGRPLALLARFLKAWFSSDLLEVQDPDASPRVEAYRKMALKTPDTFRAAIVSDLVNEIAYCQKIGLKEQASKLIAALKSSGITDAERNSSNSNRIIELTSSVEELIVQKDWGKVVEKATGALTFPDCKDVCLLGALLRTRGRAYVLLDDYQKAIEDFTAVIELENLPNEDFAYGLLDRGETYERVGENEKALKDYARIIPLDGASVDQVAEAFIHRGVIYSKIGEIEKALAEYDAVIDLAGTPADKAAHALLNRGLIYGTMGKFDKAAANFSAVIEMAGAPVNKVADALFTRAVASIGLGMNDKALEDYSELINLVGAPRDRVTMALFARVEAQFKHASLPKIEESLEEAFARGDPAEEAYGGWLGMLQIMLLTLHVSQWEEYIMMITRLYTKYKCADKLGSGILQSIRALDQGDFTPGQLDIWKRAWNSAGAENDALKLPLQSLNAAIEVLRSDPPSDRPLFQLPVELRNLVRPLLSNTLGPVPVGESAG